MHLFRALQINYNSLGSVLEKLGDPAVNAPPPLMTNTDQGSFPEVDGGGQCR